MNIVRFEFKRLIKSCLIWSIVCSGLIILFMALFPSMKDMGMQQLVSDKMDTLPKDILKAFNIDESMDFSNLYNYLTYCIQYIAMASAVYGGMLGVNSLIGEESQGTIEFLYSKPITRSKIVTSKLISICIVFLIYSIILEVMTMAVCIVIKPQDIEIVDLIVNVNKIFIGIILLGLIFMFIGMFISTFIKSDKGAIPVSIGIFFITYFLGIIGKLKDSFEWLKYLSPFDYYAPNIIVKDGFDTKFIIIGLSIMIISVVLTYIIYKNKDMRI